MKHLTPDECSVLPSGQTLNQLCYNVSLKKWKTNTLNSFHVAVPSVYPCIQYFSEMFIIYVSPESYSRLCTQEEPNKYFLKIISINPSFWAYFDSKQLWTISISLTSFIWILNYRFELITCQLWKCYPWQPY